MFCPSPGQRGLHLGDDGEDERDREADARAGEDIRQRRGQLDLQQALDPGKTQRRGELRELRLDRAHAVDRAEKHRPERAEGDHRRRHAVREAEEQDRDRDDRRGGQRAQELERRLEIGARGARGADRDAERDAEERCENPSVQHAQRGRAEGLPQSAAHDLVVQLEKRARGRGEEDRRDERELGRELPEGEDGEGEESRGNHAILRASAFRTAPTAPSQRSWAYMRSERKACCAAIMLWPSPRGLSTISTVTATTSEIASARRSPTAMRPSAAGRMILRSWST